MKLNLSQWGPQTKVATPQNDAFFFTAHLEKLIKEYFHDFKECALGLSSEEDIFRWLSYKWEQLKFKDHFEGGKNPEVRDVLRRCGLHIDDNGFVRYRHYFLLYVPSWVVAQRKERREAARRSQLTRDVEEQADKLGRALQSDVKASVETWEEKIEPAAITEEARRGPG